MAKKIKVGVIGVGHLGQHHARIYSENAKCELVGVADSNERTAQRIARNTHTVPYTDFQELLRKVEAVSVAVPTILHYEITKQLLESGIHVLVEKPITTTVEEAAELIDIAHKKNLILQVGHIERFNAAVLKLKEIVDQPRFIECHRLGPFKPRVKDIGVVLDLMIHDIDIILQIVQSPIKSLEAVGIPVLTDKEDIANVRVTFENSCIANVTVSRVTPQEMRKIRFFQRDTYISLDYANQSMDIHRRLPNPNHKPGMPKSKIVRRKIKLKGEDQLTKEIDHFLTCVSKGEEPVVTGEHGKNALELAVFISQEIRRKLDAEGIKV